MEWSAAHEPELNATERAFLNDSRASAERSQRRLRAVLAGVAALLVLSVIAAVVALEQRGAAHQQALAGDAQRLGARALVEDDLDRSLLLARQGVALDDSVQTRGNLLAALLRSPAALGTLRGDDEITTIALSPNERTLAAGTNTNKIFLFDTRTRRRLATLEPDDACVRRPHGLQPRRPAPGRRLRQRAGRRLAVDPPAPSSRCSTSAAAASSRALNRRWTASSAGWSTRRTGGRSTSFSTPGLACSAARNRRC